jgi:hypothetical protein
MQLIVTQLNELKTSFIIGHSQKMEGASAILDAKDKIEEPAFRILDNTYKDTYFMKTYKINIF